VNRGELWWAQAPAGGRRPYLILTRQAAIASLHSVLAVPATTTIRGIPTEVALDRSDGVPRDCALALDNVTLMPKALLAERICRLGAERLQQVCHALRDAVDC
jgi:mRNA interferase MazF